MLNIVASNLGLKHAIPITEEHAVVMLMLKFLLSGVSLKSDGGTTSCSSVIGIACLSPRFEATT